MDPKIREYLLKKQAEQGVMPIESEPAMPAPKASMYDEYDAKYGDAAMEQAENEAQERKSGLGWSQFAAGMGDALAGRDPSGTAKNFQDIRKGVDDSTVGSLERKKAGALKNLDAKKNINNSDPNSKESLNFRKMMESQFPKIAAQYGDDWANVSAADQDNIFKPLQLKETVEARKQAAALLAGEKQAKLEEKNELMNTSYGQARTPDDAKKIKEAGVLKKNFDAKLDELITLRKDKKGGAIWDREAVNRAKALSKDLLLDYKSLSQLGVLSQSDMHILNTIIPDDPLAFRNPVEAIQGQDSILSKMEAFKADKQKDFDNRLGEMLRNPVQQKQAGGPPPPPKMVKIADPKGIVRNIPEDQVQAALAAGGKLVQPVAGQ